MYTGPPVPTRLAGTLEASERLQQQINAILELSPDVACLQEVLADGVRSEIVRGVSGVYGASAMTNPSTRHGVLRAIVSLLLLCAYAGSCLAAWWLSGWLAPEGGRAAVSALFVVLSLAVARAMLTLKRCTLWGFAFGDSHPAGLLILHKRDVFHARGPPCATQFDEQSGDLMNILRPRGVLWQVRDSSRVKPAT
eukprot:1049233-Prymnesium_polylepis.1